MKEYFPKRWISYRGFTTFAWFNSHRFVHTRLFIKGVLLVWIWSLTWWVRSYEILCASDIRFIPIRQYDKVIWTASIFTVMDTLQWKIFLFYSLYSIFLRSHTKDIERQCRWLETPIVQISQFRTTSFLLIYCAPLVWLFGVKPYTKT